VNALLNQWHFALEKNHRATAISIYNKIYSSINSSSSQINNSVSTMSPSSTPKIKSNLLSDSDFNKFLSVLLSINQHTQSRSQNVLDFHGDKNKPSSEFSDPNLHGSALLKLKSSKSLSSDASVVYKNREMAYVVSNVLLDWSKLSETTTMTTPTLSSNNATSTTPNPSSVQLLPLHPTVLHFVLGLYASIDEASQFDRLWSPLYSAYTLHQQLHKQRQESQQHQDDSTSTLASASDSDSDNPIQIHADTFLLVFKFYASQILHSSFSSSPFSINTTAKFENNVILGKLTDLLQNPALPLSTEVYHLYLSSLIKCGRALDALKVLESGIQEEYLRPILVETIVNGLIGSGKVEMGMELFDRAVESKIIKPTRYADVFLFLMCILYLKTIFFSLDTRTTN
jgi:hypothetical protein